MNKGKALKITTNSQYHEILAKIEFFIEKGFGNLNCAQERVISGLRPSVIQVLLRGANQFWEDLQKFYKLKMFIIK